MTHHQDAPPPRAQAIYAVWAMLTFAMGVTGVLLIRVL